MAKVVKDEALASRAGRPGKYDWANWLNGKTWELEKGIDFTISERAMRSSIYMRAREEGLKVSTSTTVNGNIILRAEKPA